MPGTGTNYLKILIKSGIAIVSLIVTWMYLPEKLYETIAGIYHSTIVSSTSMEILNHKWASMFTVAAGFSLFIRKEFRIITNSLVLYIVAGILIFLAYFIGILFCFILFQYKEGAGKLIQVDDCFKLYIIFPLIILVLFGFNYICKRRELKAQL
jgi:hypothetical protein